MMAKLHEPPLWEIDPAAQALHREGLNLATADWAALSEEQRALSDQQRYVAAHRAFAVVRGYLSSLPQTPDAQLQLARIIRDDGFTHGREALLQRGGGERSELFELAHKRLEESAGITEKLIGNELHAERRPALYSEHGETVHLRRRLTVAQLVAVGDLPLGEGYLSQRDILERANAFPSAYEYLSQGSNKYYQAGYEARSALLHRMLGVSGVGTWLRRASGTLRRAELVGNPDLPQIRRVVLGAGAVALRGKRAVAKLVIAKP